MFVRFNNLNRFLYQADGVDGGGDEIETPSTDTTTEETTDASEDKETETAEGDEENHPGAEEDKADAEAAAKAKGEEKPAEASKEAAQTFTPNYDIKVYGKKVAEIPEKFRGLITDKASEDEIKGYFEKSYALDEYKPKQEAMRQKVEHYEQKVLPEYAKQDKIINEALFYIKQGDFDSFHELLGIDQNRVLKWLDQKLSFTPEQAALYNQNRELQKQMYQKTLETSQLRGDSDANAQEAQRRQVEMFSQELDYTLAKSDYAQRAKDYDAKNGANALKNLVIKHGNYAHEVEGRKLSFDEAIKEVLDRVAPAIVPQQTLKAAPPKEKPVLPVVTARPTSPTVKQPNSISELRKKAEKYSASHFDE